MSNIFSTLNDEQLLELWFSTEQPDSGLLSEIEQRRAASSAFDSEFSSIAKTKDAIAGAKPEAEEADEQFYEDTRRKVVAAIAAAAAGTTAVGVSTMSSSTTLSIPQWIAIAAASLSIGGGIFYGVFGSGDNAADTTQSAAPLAGQTTQPTAIPQSEQPQQQISTQAEQITPAPPANTSAELPNTPQTKPVPTEQKSQPSQIAEANPTVQNNEEEQEQNNTGIGQGDSQTTQQKLLQELNGYVQSLRWAIQNKEDAQVPALTHKTLYLATSLQRWSTFLEAASMAERWAKDRGKHEQTNTVMELFMRNKSVPEVVRGEIHGIRARVFLHKGLPESARTELERGINAFENYPDKAMQLLKILDTLDK